ncbi:MAG: hypothetical protein ACI93R_004000 [Flavobacteriales bacterium]|jgi:hypothetical protein
MKFYLGAFLYLFVFGFSVYGIFAEELRVGVGSNALVLGGWLKNSICIFLLFLVGIVSCIPIFVALRNALGNANK